MPNLDSKNNLTLITGGARSGKSRWAESLAAAAGKPVIYIATLECLTDDQEMVERIDRHRRRRPEGWQTLEISRGLDEAVVRLSADQQVVLIDCLAVYLSNLLLDSTREQADLFKHEETIMSSVQRLLESISRRQDLEFITVTNEVGSGIVPEAALGRAFRDLLGLANQMVAHQAQAVWLVCSGIPLKLKPSS